MNKNKFVFKRNKIRAKKRPVKLLSFVGIKKLLMVLILIFLILTIVLFTRKLLVIKNIICFEAGNPCREGIVGNLGSFVNTSPTKAVLGIKKMLGQNDLLKSYKVNYVVPGTIKVNIDLKSPVIAVKGDSNWFALLDNDGIVLDLVESTDVKTIQVNGGLPNIGDKVNDNIYFGCILYAKISKILEVESIQVENDRINLVLKNDGILYIFPGSGDSEYLVGAINLIVSRLNNPDKETTIEKSEIKEVDFRYKNPVIRKI